MKRVITLFLALAMCLPLVACGNSDKTGYLDPVSPTERGEDAPPQENKGQEPAGEKEPSTDVDLIYTFKDPSKPVAFDYPNLKVIEEGTSRVFKNSKYVIVYCRDSGEKELQDIPPALGDKFGYAVNTHITGSFSSFDIAKTDNMKVNGTDVLAIKGVIVSAYSDGSTVDLPMLGYTFIKDGMICELIGVLPDGENDADQAEMEKTVAAMIQTLRDDR